MYIPFEPFWLLRMHLSSAYCYLYIVYNACVCITRFVYTYYIFMYKHNIYIYNMHTYTHKIYLFTYLRISRGLRAGISFRRC